MASGFLSGALQGFGTATGDLTDTLFKLEQMKRMDAANKSLTDYRLAHTKKLLEDQEKEQKMTGILSNVPTTKTTQVPAPPPSDIANENYVPSGYTQAQETPLSAGELNKARAQALIQGGFPTKGIAFEKEGRAADQETFKTTMDWYKERLKNEEPQAVISEMAKNPMIAERIPNIGSMQIDRQNKIASIPVTLTEPKTVVMNGQEYTLPVGEYTYSRTPQGEKYVPAKDTGAIAQFDQYNRMAPEKQAAFRRFQREGAQAVHIYNDTSAKDAARERRDAKKNQLGLIRRYNSEVAALRGRYDSSVRSGIPMTTEDWNSGLNDIYTRYQPEFADNNIVFGKSGTPKAGITPKTRQLDSETAQAYLKQAGGDKEKARAAAKSDGYSF